ncbi:hypothetical protein MMC11_004179 [Xylographa trunciseda]|nr:hypothetical protein [Xylographa trunciseda]
MASKSRSAFVRQYWNLAEGQQLAFTEPILGHLQVPPEHKGPKSEAFRVMIGVLKNKLRSNVPSMSSAFQIRIEEAVALEVANLNDKCEKNHGDWQKVRLMPALLRIFTRVNLLAFIGEDQADRIEVYHDVMRFFWSCAKAFPILNLMPGFLLPLIGPVAMGWGITRLRVYNILLWITCQALEGEDSGDEKPVSDTFCLEVAIELRITHQQAPGHIAQWTAEMTRLQDAAAVAKITLGLLFASAFQVPMVAQFCVYSFCKHPEYHERLRAEAMECKDTSFGALNQEMPYLDSFVKETARLSPGPIRKLAVLPHELSAPRTVMVPYTSPDGCLIPAGNWIAIPQLSLMRDESVWPRALTFEGFRFVDEKHGTSESRLTHPSYEFPFWGSIRHAW